jgi:hypothetical protein
MLCTSDFFISQWYENKGLCMNRLNEPLKFFNQWQNSSIGRKLSREVVGKTQMVVRWNNNKVPVLTNEKNSFSHFLFGGYGSTLLDATFNVTTPNAYGYGELSYGDFEKYDLGLIGGVAFNFPFSKLSIKYSYGFKDVLKNTDAYMYLKGARNDQISISFTRYFK